MDVMPSQAAVRILHFQHTLPVGPRIGRRSPDLVKKFKVRSRHHADALANHGRELHTRSREGRILTCGAPSLRIREGHDVGQLQAARWWLGDYDVPLLTEGCL